MEPTRRTVITGMSAVALASVPACREAPRESPAPPTTPADGAAPDRPPEPPAWEPAGTLDPAAFAWGVAAGDATADGVVLTARTLEAEVTLEVVAAEGDGWITVATHEGLVPVDGAVRIELTGLAADTAHRYVFRSADGARRSRVGRFRTALASGGFRKIVLGATSCLGEANSALGSLARAAAEELDALLLLGDTVYADGAVTLDDYREVWKRAAEVEGLQEALASTSVIATWDDHEVANNWTLGEETALQAHVEPEQVEAGLAAFREAIPQRVGPGGRGLWRSLAWGDVLEILVLDARGERDDAERIVSDEQLAWAVDRLQRSTATFKLVLASVHVTDHTALLSFVNQEDRFQGYPAQREALVAAAEAAGAVFVTGDMHYGAIQKVGAPGATGAEVWEVAAGPGGSDLFRLDEIAELAGGWPEQYPHVVVDWTYARLVLDPGTRTITVQLVDEAGVVRAERAIDV